MENKKYVLPDEIVDLNLKSIALFGLRNKYSMIPFGFHKAKKLAIEAEQLRYKFWKEVRELYPELAGKDLSHKDGIVIIEENN